MKEIKKNFRKSAEHRMTSIMNNGWNNPGLLVIGGGNDNLDEAYIALWAISKAPLILAKDIGKYSSQSSNAMKSKSLINIQKNLKSQVHCAKYCRSGDDYSVYVGEYKAKEEEYNAPTNRLVAVINWSKKDLVVKNLLLSEIGVYS